MSQVSRARRAGRRFVLVVSGLGLAAGCAITPPDPPPPVDAAPPPPRANRLPGDCGRIVSDPDQAPAVLDQAGPGDKICFTGTRFIDTELTMRASGTSEQSISLVADGTTVRSFEVTADHVTVDGFTISDGAGLDLVGTGLVARNNVVRNAADDGIVCANCRDGLVEANTVWRADGTGIVLDGEQSMLRNNTVLESVMREEGDADGVRFFGTGLRLIGNTIQDIKTTDYVGDRVPHTDCFQTFESEDRPTYDVLIADNVCENVDVQCLIATGKGIRPAVPHGLPTITFENNSCTVYGSQAVLVESYPNVMIRNNRFIGPRYRVVFLSRGSVNCTVVDNTIVGDIPPFWIDEASRPGFHAEGNKHH